MKRRCITRYLQHEDSPELAQQIASKCDTVIMPDVVMSMARNFAENADNLNRFTRLVHLLGTEPRNTPASIQLEENDEEFIRQAEYVRMNKKSASSSSCIAKKTAPAWKMAKTQRIFDLRDSKRLLQKDPYWPNNPDFVYIGRGLVHHTGIGEVAETRWSVPADFHKEPIALDKIPQMYVDYLEQSNITAEEVTRELGDKFLVCNCGHVFDAPSSCHGHVLLKMIAEKQK